MKSSKYVYSFVHIFCLCVLLEAGDPLVNNNRPPPSQRSFNSTIIEDTLKHIVPKMIDQDLALLFVNCFPNSLDTTVSFNNDMTNPDTFVITGDIQAMWLRDSSGQIYPYVEFAPQDPILQQMIKGVIKRQMDCINVDSYANAFNKGPSGSPWDKDERHPPMIPILWEGKYEIDSLAWVLRLSAHYFNVTKDDSICTTTWFSAVSRIAQTIKYQQQTLDDMSDMDLLYYSFARTTNNQLETLLGGVGVPSRKCGLSRAGFRPSDDAHRLPFQIAGNAFAKVTLSAISQMVSTHGQCYNQQLAQNIIQIASDIDIGIQLVGIVPHSVFGKVYAYEADGFGSHLIMDDANVPSLLSLPYLGVVDKEDKVYNNTRTLLLSDSNPYYFCGKAGCGVGSPHTGRGNIWPMGLIMRSLTSTSDSEIIQCLNLLKTTTSGTYFMHESFNKDNPTIYTRSWFSWANGMFGELILKLVKERPYILFGSK